MHIIENIPYTNEELESLFVGTEEGQNMTATQQATRVAASRLNVPVADVQWKIPDVFDIRYGSNYVATAYCGDRGVRFISTLGDFQEGDDK